jgi:hypothetical protein
LPGVVGAQPYDTAGYILQLAVSISGDTGPNGIAGNILNAAQPTTIPLLNKAYRDVQDRLQSAGVETFSKYWQLIAIPAANTSNPSSQVYFSYTGFFDGQEMQSKWYLPPDCLKPLELWERQNGNNYWIPMKQCADQISTRPIMPYFNEWDFETDILYVPPVSQVNDIKIKGICYAPDISSVNSPILVARCQSALAYKFLVDVAGGRGGLEMAAIWKQQYEDAIQLIINRTARKESYGAYFRRPFRSRRSARGRDGN